MKYIRYLSRKVIRYLSRTVGSKLEVYQGSEIKKRQTYLYKGQSIQEWAK